MTEDYLNKIEARANAATAAIRSGLEILADKLEMRQ